MDPAEERRMPHLDRHEQHFIEREKHGHLDNHGQAAGNGIHFLALVKLHHLLLLAQAVFGEARAQAFDFRLKLLHPAHRFVGRIRKREEDELDHNGEQQDRHAEIADEIVQMVEQPEHRPREEPEPAPIDGEIETLDAELVLIILQRLHHFGAREQAVRHGERAVRREFAPSSR